MGRSAAPPRAAPSAPRHVPDGHAATGQGTRLGFRSRSPPRRRQHRLGFVDRFPPERRGPPLARLPRARRRALLAPLRRVPREAPRRMSGRDAVLWGVLLALPLVLAVGHTGAP